MAGGLWAVAVVGVALLVQAVDQDRSVLVVFQQISRRFLLIFFTTLWKIDE
jgi:hypothetical protein